MSMQQIMFASLASGGGGFIIEGSGLFDGSTGFLSRTPSSAGNRQIWTFSTIIKVPQLASGQMELLNTRVADANLMSSLRINSTGELMYFERDASASVKCNVQTTAKFRDPAAFMHVQFSVDTTDATASDRVKIYVNGVQMALTETTTMALNYSTNVNTTVNHNIGVEGGGSADYNGYMARAVMIDGQALAPTSFGELTNDGFWSISDVSGLDFGDNGFLLTGQNVSTGTDSSGNSNNFSKTGSIISTSDSPTNDADNGYSNGTTFSPLEPDAGTLSNGNLTGTTQFFKSDMTIPKTGKWYWEYTCDAGTSASSVYGIADSTGNSSGTSQCRIIRIQNGEKYSPDVGAWQAYGTSWTAGDIIGFAVDMDNGAIYVSKNGTYYNSGDPTSGASKTGAMFTDLLTATTASGWYAAAYAGDGSNIVTANFGISTFNTAAPTDYLALLPVNITPDVINYEDEYYIEAGISHSNGSTTAVTLPKSVSGGAMARIKRTDSSAGTSDWLCFDTIRGTNKAVKWNSQEAEDTSTYDDQNLTGTVLTLPSALTSGSYLIEIFYIGSYFQVKTYTGSGANKTESYPASLGSLPGFMAVISRTATGTFNPAWHNSLTDDTYYLKTDTTAAQAAAATMWNSTAPSATVLALGSNAESNTNLNTYVAYIFADSGPYQFGKYTGNGGNGDAGPFINVGGGPQSLFAKKLVASTIGWIHHAGVYNNPVNANETDWYCSMNTTNAIGESTGTSGGVGGDFVSTGWKHRGGYTDMNASGVTIVYGAFGIQPMTNGSVDQSRAR